MLTIAVALVLGGCGSVEETDDSGSSGEERTGRGNSGGGEASGNGASGGGEEAADSGASAHDPEAIKALYLPGATAEAGFEDMARLAGRTEVNGLVVDVKEAGFTSYPSEVPLAREIGATTEQIPDLEDLVERIHDEDLYAIARLAVFQDDVLPNERPDLAVQDSTTGGPWYNYQGATWSNPYREEVRAYNIAIAKEAAEAGFDEVQFDYVRFPSDGPMANLAYGEETFPTQEAAIAAFLEEAQRELEPTGADVSADVFGLVGVNDYVGVGQVVSQMSPHLDVISPMVYPSHYPAGSYGYDNPDGEPYDIVKYAMEDFETKGREANPDLIIRPWLQDFEYISDYTAEEVEAQMKATYDSGLEGWILWNAAGEYTAEALAREDD